MICEIISPVEVNGIRREVGTSVDLSPSDAERLERLGCIRRPDPLDGPAEQPAAPFVAPAPVPPEPAPVPPEPAPVPSKRKRRKPRS